MAVSAVGAVTVAVGVHGLDCRAWCGRVHSHGSKAGQKRQAAAAYLCGVRRIR